MRMQSAEQKKTPWPGPPQTHFSVAKATLESQMSVCLSVHPSVTETTQPLSIAPIDHRAYQPSSYWLSDLLLRLLSHFGLFKM